jgi:hypothetical protein
MLRLASDEDVNGRILKGLRLRLPNIDLQRSEVVLGKGTKDPDVLAWAVNENRVLITNDRETMLELAYERAATSRDVPGVIATTNSQSIGAAIEDIALIAECMPAEEIRDLVVVFLPCQK